MDEHEWGEDDGLLSRGAYHLARQIAEARRFDCQTGRDRDHPGAWGDAAALTKEVLRRLRPAAGDARARALSTEGIADALAGRRPRW